MQKKIRYGVSALLSLVMVFSAVGMQVSAEESKKIVVLGDGISTSSGLTGEEQSYVTMLSDYIGASGISFAQEGYTTEDVLVCLDRADVQTALADADIILLSVGSHDIMDPYAEQVNVYQEEFGFESITDLFGASMKDYGFTSESQLIPYANTLASKAKLNRKTAQENILAIGEKLSQYTSAQVICLNVYNCMDTIENYNELSVKRQVAYDSISNPIKGVLDEYVNNAYSQLASKYGYTVVDTYSLFSKQAYLYTHPTTVDVKPTALGHEKIALEVAQASGLYMMGDVNGDREINAVDAAAVLIHAASVGAQGKGTLNTVQWAAGNVNQNEDVNASDAASILIYAAVKGGGGDPSFDNLTGQK